MNDFKRHAVLTLLLLLLTASTASAFYVLDASGKSRTESRGHDVPFAHALKMIVPSSWATVVEGGMELSLQDVSWGDEGTWMEAVLATAKQANTEVRFDFEAKKLYVRPNVPKNIPQVQPKVAETAPAPGAPAPGPSSAAPLLTGPSPIPLGIPEPEGMWELVPGRIKVQIEKWGTTAGYQVIWDASKDFEIGVNAAFNGTFRKAVHNVVESLRESGANVQAKIYEANRVLVIKGE